MENISLEIATLCVGVLAFIGVILNIIFLAKRSREDRQIKVVVNSRLAIIDKLREMVSGCCKIVSMLTIEANYSKDRIEEFIMCKGQVILLLDFDDKREERIKLILERIESSMNKIMFAADRDNRQVIMEQKTILNQLNQYFLTYIAICIKSEREEIKKYSNIGERDGLSFEEAFSLQYEHSKELKQLEKLVFRGDNNEI